MLFCTVNYSVLSECSFEHQHKDMYTTGTVAKNQTSNKSGEGGVKSSPPPPAGDCQMARRVAPSAVRGPAVAGVGKLRNQPLCVKLCTLILFYFPYRINIRNEHRESSVFYLFMFCYFFFLLVFYGPGLRCRTLYYFLQFYLYFLSFEHSFYQAVY